MRRILLKLSGEALAGSKRTGFDGDNGALCSDVSNDNGTLSNLYGAFACNLAHNLCIVRINLSRLGVAVDGACDIQFNIAAQSAVIAGAVKGDIDVHGPVVLDTSAIVMGNIKSKAVQINNGAVIEGMCSQCYALSMFSLDRPLQKFPPPVTIPIS